MPEAILREGAFAVASPAPSADPAMVAIPTVIAGAVGLFLTTVGFVPPSAALAAIPVILAATCLGLLIGTIWAAALGSVDIHRNQTMKDAIATNAKNDAVVLS
jgi:uncharacterized protein